jgi:hypothetical protein
MAQQLGMAPVVARVADLGPAAARGGRVPARA